MGIFLLVGGSETHHLFSSALHCVKPASSSFVRSKRVRYCNNNEGCPNVRTQTADGKLEDVNCKALA